MIEIKKLKKIIDKQFNSEESKEHRDNMNRFLKYYKGDYWSKDKNDISETEGKIFANLILSTVMTIAPILTDNRPMWSVRSRKPEYNVYAQAYKMAGEALWDELGMDALVYRWVMDSLILEHGIAKIYFDPSYGEFGEIKFEIVDPRCFVMAPGYTDPWDSPWCGEVIRKPVSWIKDHYKDKAKKIKADGEGEDKDITPEGKDNYEYAHDFASLYCFWIKDDSIENYQAEREDKVSKEKKPKYPNGRYIVFCGEEVLDDKPYPYNHGKPPYVMLYDYIVPHEFYGMGEANQIETLVLEFNLLLRKLTRYIRNWTHQNGTIEAGSGLDPEKWKEEITHGDTLHVVNPGMKAPVFPPKAQLDPTVFSYIQMIPQMIEEISGVTDVTKGIVGKKQRQSAHEIATLVETSYTRTRQRVRNLEAALKRAFTLIIEIMQEYYSEPRTYSRMVEGNPVWTKVSNSPVFAKKITSPFPTDQEGNNPQVPPNVESQDQQGLDDYKKLCEGIGLNDSVYADFVVEIQTSSTLPKDQQSLANMVLQLASVQLTPNSVVDRKSVLEILQFPGAEEMQKRFEELEQKQQQNQGAQQQNQGAQQPQGGM